jgi:hypothetical protein
VTELRTLRTDAVDELLSSRCQDCNGQAVHGVTDQVDDDVYLLVLSHEPSCPLWPQLAHAHGVDPDDVLVHPVGILAGTEDTVELFGSTRRAAGVP